jgi:hypothetical protein
MKQFVGEILYNSSLFYRSATSPLRLLPDFIIIGAQKGGTSSLYRYLMQHPLIRPSFMKEVHYFDLHFAEGANWYRARFPLSLYKYYLKQVRKQNIITGEASPYYMPHPHVPKRVAALVPQAKLIVLLRNPIDRAYSHYHHEIKHKHETLSFEEAIGAEEARLQGELDKLVQDEQYYSYNHHRFSYLSRGIYVDQLKSWENFFDRSQILILETDNFFGNLKENFKKVIDFLGLPHWQPEQFSRYNVGRYNQQLEPSLRKQLIEYFRPHNQRLYQHIDMDFGWDEE